MNDNDKQTKVPENGLPELLSMLIKSNIEDKTLPLNVQSDTCGEHQIKLVFGGNREYSETDDSEFVKRIKSYGILDDEDIVFKNGYMFTKGGSFHLDDDMGRDFTYKWEFVKKRDNITKSELNDKQVISFMLMDPNKHYKNLLPFNYDNYMNGDVSMSEDAKESDNEDDDYEMLLYETFMNNGLSIDNLGLVYENEVILKCSYANILFSYPNFNSNTAFTIHADDEICGFTFKELALKAMQKYHLLYFLFKNYDMEKGTLINENSDNTNHFNTFENRCFRPTLWESEWTENGLLNLVYNKQTDQWKFECCDYI